MERNLRKERVGVVVSNKYEGRVLVIESDGMDFENNPEHFRRVIDKVDAELFGLFSENNWNKENL